MGPTENHLPHIKQQLEDVVNNKSTSALSKDPSFTNKPFLKQADVIFKMNIQNKLKELKNRRGELIFFYTCCLLLLLVFMIFKELELVTFEKLKIIISSGTVVNVF